MSEKLLTSVFDRRMAATSPSCRGCCGGRTTARRPPRAAPAVAAGACPGLKGAARDDDQYSEEQAQRGFMAAVKPRLNIMPKHLKSMTPRAVPVQSKE